jgi:hypothetical protein
MGTKQKIEKYNNMLRKYIAQKKYVKIYLSFFGENEDLSGFILDRSEDFLLIQTDSDFDLDGYAIITNYDYDSIRSNDYDRTQKKILKAEGTLAEKYGIKIPINLESWASILKDLAAADRHIIARSVRKQILDFNIGPIERISKKKFKIRDYDPNGKLDKKPTSIKFDDLRIIKFDDSYSTIFRKYLN